MSGFHLTRARKPLTSNPGATFYRGKPKMSRIHAVEAVFGPPSVASEGRAEKAAEDGGAEAL